MNIGASIIELWNPLSRHFSSLYIFTKNLYNLTMNFNWLNIPCILKSDYRQYVTVNEVGNCLRHFERSLKRVKTTQSGRNGVTGQTVNQRDECASTELRYHHCSCGRTKRYLSIWTRLVF
ncbi:uncharacterized protein TNCV_650301 [Trichonephila clavipes]|nr:uncharacterized protein TNCV_650301 [Trichonephila clavipes]